MQFMTGSKKTLTFLFTLLLVTSVATAKAKVPTEPLEKRVKDAELIFTGKIIDKTIQGDWARAKLLVELPLRGVEKEETVEVIWRIKVGDTPIYDAPEGKQGVALLSDKHEGRYWLRDDKFEGLDKLEKIEELIGNQE